MEEGEKEKERKKERGREGGREREREIVQAHCIDNISHEDRKPCTCM